MMTKFISLSLLILFFSTVTGVAQVVGMTNIVNADGSVNRLDGRLFGGNSVALQTDEATPGGLPGNGFERFEVPILNWNDYIGDGVTTNLTTDYPRIGTLTISAQFANPVDGRPQSLSGLTFINGVVGGQNDRADFNLPATNSVTSFIGPNSGTANATLALTNGAGGGPSTALITIELEFTDPAYLINSFSMTSISAGSGETNNPDSIELLSATGDVTYQDAGTDPSLTSDGLIIDGLGNDINDINSLAVGESINFAPGNLPSEVLQNNWGLTVNGNGANRLAYSFNYTSSLDGLDAEQLFFSFDARADGSLIPEPSSLLLLLMPMFALARRRVRCSR